MRFSIFFFCFLVGSIILVQSASLKKESKKSLKRSKFGETRSDAEAAGAVVLDSIVDDPSQVVSDQQIVDLEIIETSLPDNEPEVLQLSTDELQEEIIDAKPVENLISVSDSTSPEEIEENDVQIVETLPATSSTFTQRVRRIIRRILELLGLRPEKKGGEKSSEKDAESRMIESAGGHKNENKLWKYKDEFKMTIGSILGRSDCMKRAACSAGSYLRRVRGKEIVLIILEKVAPNTWRDTVRTIKDSAIHDDDNCEITCLDDE